MWDQLAASDDIGTGVSDVVYGKLDCTAHRAMMKEYAVHAFPTLLFFEKGGKKIRRYSGPRTFDSIATFAQSGWKDVEECARACPSKLGHFCWPSLVPLAAEQLVAHHSLAYAACNMPLTLRRACQPAATQAAQVVRTHAERPGDERQEGGLRDAPDPHAVPCPGVRLVEWLKARRGARRRPAQHEHA